ncbi:malonyl-CoA O-methyltransferase [Actinacidiphila yanglinensis]|uniref:Malonyl-CoA O-methyltransferase n=1 Tax=Actinacidiphila yanglinensis TaxID=310779 RepID=A0A1H6EAC2_9ACTN|nr:class I SAM-dependent methyltransferase [Actinacidiphila yanglinensis]SEG94221.1 malonyl-CoA O-methyltransferase [Actinacidiphila yanglinensis]
MSFTSGPLDAFASEDVYRAQQSVYRTGSGPDARDVLSAAVGRLSPGDLLEAGCGEGALARHAMACGHRVVAVDGSARMVELARAEGVDARVCVLPELPFPAGSFDHAVAAWVLHYLTDDQVLQALREFARVVRPGGTLVLATNSDRHMAELWARLPSARYRLTFPAERAADLLATIGARAEVTEVEGTVVFQDDAQARRFLRNQVRPASAVDRMAAIEGSLTVTRRAAVIVAEVPR